MGLLTSLFAVLKDDVFRTLLRNIFLTGARVRRQVGLKLPRPRGHRNRLRAAGAADAVFTLGQLNGGDEFFGCLLYTSDAADE